MSAQEPLVLELGLQVSTKSSAGSVAATKSPTHENPSLGTNPRDLTFNSCPTAEAGCICPQ